MLDQSSSKQHDWHHKYRMLKENKDPSPKIDFDVYSGPTGASKRMMTNVAEKKVLDALGSFGGFREAINGA